jgi:hypothetical protein
VDRSARVHLAPQDALVSNAVNFVQGQRALGSASEMIAGKVALERTAPKSAMGIIAVEGAQVPTVRQGAKDSCVLLTVRGPLAQQAATA